jgi:hypothetical protein
MPPDRRFAELIAFQFSFTDSLYLNQKMMLGLFGLLGQVNCIQLSIIRLIKEKTRCAF